MKPKTLKTIADCHADMAKLSVSHAYWMANYEDAPPLVVEPLEELLNSAPNAFARGVIVGKLSILRELGHLPFRVNHEP
jgi:hypothetical protein